jgi:hypothetical protein
VNAAPPQSLLELYEASVSRHGSRPLFLKMLTPSLKLKRRHIVTRWRREIDRLYAGGEGSPEAQIEWRSL